MSALQRLQQEAAELEASREKRRLEEAGPGGVSVSVSLDAAGDGLFQASPVAVRLRASPPRWG